MKGGEFGVQNKTGLMEFLMGKTDGKGGIKEDIEVIASVPFCLGGDAGEGKNSIAWTFSTFDLDRYDERVDPAGWDFSQYMKNPVVQWAQCFDIPAIGRAEGIYTDATGLHGSIVFNPKDFDPFGWSIGQRVEAGVIRAGSVGFRVLEIEVPSKEDGKDGTSLIFRKQELLEFSICNVPANPFALAHLGLTKGMKETKQDSGSSSFWGNIIQHFEGANYGQ
jgi:HK97 family phage prohead protease